MQITTPAPIGDVYSDVNMRVHLATAKSINTPCVDDDCTPNKEFDQQVQELGTRLATSAFDTYPELGKRISRFEFVVAEKEELGSTSNAAGKVVIFRGVQELHLDEQALAFVIAREMGHTIGRHHDENSGTSIMLSVLVGVLFPASNIFHALHGSAAVANATSSTTVATTAATTAASSATSFVSSRVLLESIRPDQLREADSIAVRLLAGLGWSGRDTADILDGCTQVNGGSSWDKDFRISVAYAKTLEEEVAMASADPEAEAPDFQVAQNTDQEPSVSYSSEIKAKAERSEMGLNVEPVQDMGNGNKLVVVADELVAEPGKAAAKDSEVSTRFEGAEIVAKNEVDVLPDVMAVDALPVPEAEVADAKFEEHEVPAEHQASPALKEKSRLSATASHQAVKKNARSAMAKKPAPSAGLNKKSIKLASTKVSKTAPKVAARNIRLKLAKAAINGNKQVNTKKLYASNSSKVKVAMCVRCGQIK